MSADRTPYCGRFAPSPTGPLHAGSLLAAVASYVDARAHGGRWLVRIEDIDPPRQVPGATRSILETLHALGLDPDGEVVYQSERTTAYDRALERLVENAAVYRCSCTRTDIARFTGPPPPGGELRYPGMCRLQPLQAAGPHAWRLRVAPGTLAFHDRLQGPQDFDVAGTVGDFVVKRRDGPYAYQLAVVVDDAAAGVTHVVRGCDLLDNTPRQILLQRALGLPTPGYLHVPVLVDEAGHKLSKSTQAPPIDRGRPAAMLWDALQILRMNPPSKLREARSRALLDWAISHWTPAALASVARIVVTPG